MGFWEFITNATPPTAIIVIGGWVAIEKNLWTALAIMGAGAIVYFIALGILVHLEKYKTRWNS